MTPLLTSKGTDLRGFFDLNVSRAAAAKSYLKLFLDNNIDAILMPVAPHTTVPFNSCSGVSYTGLWNLLDFPAITLPVGKVQDSDLPDDISNATYGPQDTEVYSLCMILLSSLHSCFSDLSAADVMRFLRHWT
jgi:amidase